MSQLPRTPEYDQVSAIADRLRTNVLSEQTVEFCYKTGCRLAAAILGRSYVVEAHFQRLIELTSDNCQSFVTLIYLNHQLINDSVPDVVASFLEIYPEYSEYETCLSSRNDVFNSLLIDPLNLSLRLRLQKHIWDFNRQIQVFLTEPDYDPYRPYHPCPLYVHYAQHVAILDSLINAQLVLQREAWQSSKIDQYPIRHFCRTLQTLMTGPAALTLERAFYQQLRSAHQLLYQSTKLDFQYSQFSKDKAQPSKTEILILMNELKSRLKDTQFDPTTNG